MDKDIETILRGSLAREDSCGFEFRRCLRMFLEWNAFGRPVERYAEYSGLVALNAPCDNLVNSRTLLDLEVTDKELQIVIDMLISHLKKRGPQFKWIPYLLKGLSGFRNIEEEITTFVAESWPEDEEIAQQAILIHFTLPLNKRQKKLLEVIKKKCHSSILNETAKQKLEISEQMAR